MINRVNPSFHGNLYLRNPNLWTNNMRQAISDNESIQNKLKDHDIFGSISTKKEKKIPHYLACHSQGDTIYKVSFTTRKDNSSVVDRIKNGLGLLDKKYQLTRHFHSERTIVKRIENLIMD